jgi:hypothetical protein
MRLSAQWVTMPSRTLRVRQTATMSGASRRSGVFSRTTPSSDQRPLRIAAQVEQVAQVDGEAGNKHDGHVHGQDGGPRQQVQQDGAGQAMLIERGIHRRVVNANARHGRGGGCHGKTSYDEDLTPYPSPRGEGRQRHAGRHAADAGDRMSPLHCAAAVSPHLPPSRAWLPTGLAPPRAPGAGARGRLGRGAPRTSGAEAPGAAPRPRGGARRARCSIHDHRHHTCSLSELEHVWSC